MMVTLGLADFFAWVMDGPPESLRVYNRSLGGTTLQVARGRQRESVEWASLLHCKVNSIWPAFELGPFFARQRFSGDDKQTFRAHLSARKQSVAHGLGALVGELAHVVVAHAGVLHHELFHFRHGVILSQANQVSRLGKTFFPVGGFQV